MKPHKFFEKYLDNNLPILQKDLENRYEWIEGAKVGNVTPLANSGEYWTESGSISTVKWRQYNVFQFHSNGIHNLFTGIRDTLKEACEYYEIDFAKEQYMLQGWFNINTKSTGKLDWHDHGGPYAPNFHGYYCVNAEPSITYYKINGKEENVVENVNKNNRLIVSEMGHPHAQGDWTWEGNRITIAYDMVPLRLLPRGPEVEQHWLPLI